jgi:hypothetical protein
MFALMTMLVDISFPVISCARFSANHGMPHWIAVVRIFRYLKGSADLKLTYRKMTSDPAPLMYGYTDADWATSDIDKRRSMLGFVLFLSGGAIVWLTKFGLVCFSIFESEYSSLKELAKNAVAAWHLLEELPLSWITQNATLPTTLLTVSLASQQVSNNPKYPARTKHMEIAKHRIQQVIRQGHVRRLQHIDRKFNLADMMVKALTKSEFRIWLPNKNWRSSLLLVKS